MKLLGAVFIGWSMVGCGGASTSGGTVSPEVLAVEREVGGWYTRWSESLVRGNGAAVGAAFGANDVFIGAHPDEVAVGRAAITAKVRPAAERELASTALSIGVASDSQAAWVADVLGAERPLRSTVVVERQGSGWRALLAHTSYAISGDEARKREEDKSFAPLRDVGDAVPEDARQLAQLLSQGLGSADKMVALISTQPGTSAFGPSPDDRFTGTHDVSEWVRSLYAREGARLVRNGGLRAGIAAGGEVGWVATSVDMTVIRGTRELARPCRFTVVFTRQGGSWAIVQMHLSLALPEVT